MNPIQHNLVTDSPNLAKEFPATTVAPSEAPKLGAFGSIRVHWPEYLMEACLLGAFMVSACVFGAGYEFPPSPLRQAMSSQLLAARLTGTSIRLYHTAMHDTPL